MKRLCFFDFSDQVRREDFLVRYVWEEEACDPLFLGRCLAGCNRRVYTWKQRKLPRDITASKTKKSNAYLKNFEKITSATVRLARAAAGENTTTATAGTCTHRQRSKASDT